MLDTTRASRLDDEERKAIWVESGDIEEERDASTTFQGVGLHDEALEPVGYSHALSLNDDRVQKDKYVALDGTSLRSWKERYCTSSVRVGLALFAFIGCLVLIAWEMLGVPHGLNGGTLYDIGNSSLLVVSMDGYAANYFHNNSRAHCRQRIDAFADEGFFSNYLQNVFATKTFPNHYSIVTGLVEEAHGIINNNMYDPEFDAVFTSTTVEPRWWEEGEPIWITANKSNVVSGTMYWPGSNVKNKGIYPTYWFNYNQQLPFSDRVNTVLGWLKLPAAKRPRIMTLYFDQPDTNGHMYGPHSDEVTDAMCEVDAAVGQLLDGLQEMGVSDQLNVILLADHGMTALSHERVVYLSDYTDINLFDAYGGSPVQSVFPKDPSSTQKIYDDLHGKHPNMTVYLKEDLPAKLHYEHNRRIGEIVIVGDLGWQILVSKQDYAGLLGDHGYDASDYDMHPIFMGRGPQFTKGGATAMPVVHNVDLYNMMCHILDIKPSPNNGTFSKIKPFLSEFSS